MIKTFVCPKCGELVTEHPALSRVDNKTDICSQCGMIEALQAMMKFELGQIVVTRGINSAIEGSEKFAQELQTALRKYITGDWGCLPNEDKASNEQATKDGGRILGGYKTSKGKIWIITESDRSATTILFPNEY